VEAVEDARTKIAEADKYGKSILGALVDNGAAVKLTDAYQRTVESYQNALASYASLLELDHHAFQLAWF
jgi:hypothetical protein